MEQPTMAYIVTSGSYSDYTIERVYLDRAAAQRFVDAYNTTQSRDGYEIEEFQIGVPEHAQFDGQVWKGVWTREPTAEEQDRRWGSGWSGWNKDFYTNLAAGKFPPDRPAPSHPLSEHYQDKFTIEEDWHTGDPLPKAKVTYTNPTMAMVYGTSKEHVEKSLHDVARRLKAEHAGIA